MNDLTLPATQYALSGEISIAYQVMGDGPVDLIMVPGLVSHIEFGHEFAWIYGILTSPIDVRTRSHFRQAGPGLVRPNLGCSIA